MRTLLFGLLLLAAAVPAAYAQSLLQTPRNHGMGGGGAAYVGSFHANFVNPANLMLQGDRPYTVRFGLASASASAGGPLANVPTYNRYLTRGLTVTNEMAGTMLDEWFGESDHAAMGYSAEAVAFGLAYRNESWAASFAIRNRVLGNVSMSRGAAEAFFQFLDPAIFGQGKAVDWSIDNTAFTEVSLGYAREVWKSANGSAMFNLGVAPKLLLAHNADRLEFTSMLSVSDAGNNQGGLVRHDFDYRVQSTGKTADGLARFHTANALPGSDPSLADYVNPSPLQLGSVAATGLGLDMGASLQVQLPGKETGVLAGAHSLAFGLSVTDLGGFNLRGAAHQYTNTGSILYEGFRFDQGAVDRDFGGDSRAYFEAFLKDSVGLGNYLDYSPEKATGTYRGLPGSLNVGTYLQAGPLGLAADIGKGMNGTGVNSTKPYLALGTQYRFGGFLPVRAGFRTGGPASASFHFGTGVELANFEFSLSVSSTGGRVPGGSSLGAAMSGLIFQF